MQQLHELQPDIDPKDQLRVGLVGANGLVCLVCLLGAATFAATTFSDAPGDGLNLGTELLLLVPVGMFGYGGFVALKYTPSRRATMMYFMLSILPLVISQLLVVAMITHGVNRYDLDQLDEILDASCRVAPADRPCYCQCPQACATGREVDECASVPCQYGGDCVDGMEDYTCSCMPPWSGRNCEINFKCPEESWDQEKANVRHVCFNGRAVQHYNLPEVRPNALAPAEKGRVLVDAVRN